MASQIVVFLLGLVIVCELALIVLLIPALIFVARLALPAEAHGGQNSGD